MFARLVILAVICHMMFGLTHSFRLHSVCHKAISARLLNLRPAVSPPPSSSSSSMSLRSTLSPVDPSPIDPFSDNENDRAIASALAAASTVNTSSLKMKAAEAFLQTLFRIRPLFKLASQKARSSMVERVCILFPPHLILHIVTLHF